MQLHFSLPDHLAVGAEFITSSDTGSTGTTPTTEASSSSDKKDDPSAVSTVISYAFPLILVGAAYFLWLRPRTKRMRAQQAQQRELRTNTSVGDEILLTSGVYGFITGMDEAEDIVWVEIDDDVQIRVSKDAILRRVTQDTAADEPDADDDGSDDGVAPPPRAMRSGGGAVRPSLKGRSKSSPAAGSTPDTPGEQSADAEPTAE